MANSVPVTTLTAEPVFGAVNLTAGVAGVNPCLPYLQVSAYEYWASTTNDRSQAVKLTTSSLPFWQHTAAAVGQIYWYWAKTIDASGAVSEFYPATTTSTVTAAAKTAASLSLSMSAPAIVIAADAAGTVASFASAASTAKVLDGADDITAGWTLSATGVGVTVGQSGAVFSVTGMAADNGYFDVQASRAGYPNLTARVTVAKSRAGQTGAPGEPGAPGASAPLLRLAATSQVFQITAAGANSPASITFTASLLGGLAGTPTFTVTAGTATLSGTGLSRTLTFANMATDTVTVQASLSGSSDTITVAKIREGATGSTGTPGTPGANGIDAITALLSNETHTLPASSAGVVSSFAGAVATLTVYQGIVDVSASWAVSKVDSGVTSTLSDKTVTVTAMSTDTGYVEITATRSGYASIVKRFTLTKARAGTNGTNGTNGSTGPRGSMTFYVSGQNAWSDTVANSTANAAPGGRQLNDVVTMYNATTFSQTRFWNGSAWVVITQAIDGNLLVSGSIGATQISSQYVYTGAITAEQVTAGIFTGRTFQTAASGKRIVIYSNQAGNKFQYINAAGDIVVDIGGGVSAQGIIAQNVSGSGGAIEATNKSTSGAAFYGFNTNTGPIFLGSTAGTQGNAFLGSTSGSSAAFRGTASGTSGTGNAFEASTSGSGAGFRAITTGGSGAGMLASVTLAGTGVAGWFETTTTAGSHGLRGINSATTGAKQGGSGIVGVRGDSGGFALYSERGGIGPFTGQHDGLIRKTRPIDPGDIVVDLRVVGKPSLNDAITEVARSSAPLQPTAVGVFESRRPMNDEPPAALAEFFTTTDAEGNTISRPRRSARFDNLTADFDVIVMNSVGEGLINVCAEGGDIAAGDLIVTSSRPGKGMRQADDIVRSYTVAKAREAVTFRPDRPNQIELIACIYLCG